MATPAQSKAILKRRGEWWTPPSKDALLDYLAEKWKVERKDHIKDMLDELLLRKVKGRPVISPSTYRDWMEYWEQHWDV